MINFGVIYGLSPFGLAQQLGIDTKEAAKFIAAYFERYSGVKKYLDAADRRSPQDAASRKTLFGRIRPIPEINSPQPNLRNFAERTAMNTPMQGAAADLIKLAMIELDRRLADGFESQMILQVHDELLFEAPEEEIPRLTKLVKEVMEGRAETARAAGRGYEGGPELARHEIAMVASAFVRACSSVLMFFREWNRSEVKRWLLDHPGRFSEPGEGREEAHQGREFPRNQEAARCRRKIHSRGYARG